MNSQEDLLRAFHMSLEDLEANRQGQLGATQKRRLLRSGNWNVVMAFFLILMLTAIMYGVVKKPLVPIQWILYILLSVAVLLLGTQYFRQTRTVVAQGRVERLIGSVHVRSRGRSGWFLTVAGQSFQLPVFPLQIQQDASYRVYFVPHLRVVVAMELDDAANSNVS